MSRLVKNVLSNWVGLVLAMATAYFISPFLVRNLGDTWYGLWILIMSTTGYMGLVDGGLKISIVKYVAKADATNDQDELNRVVSTATMIYMALMVVVVVASVVLAGVFDRIFVVPPETLATARVVVVIAGLSLAVTLGTAVYGGFVAGMQRYDIANGIGVVTLIFRTIAIVVLILAGYGIVALGLVHLGVQIVTAIAHAVIVRRLRPSLRITPRLASLASARTLYGYSFAVLVTVISDTLLFKTGSLLAGMYLMPAAVTYYSIAGTLAEYLHKIVLQMAMVLHPYSTAKDAKGDTRGLHTAVIVGTKLCVLVGLPGTIVMVVLGTPFIAHWMGPEYAAVAGPVMIAIAVGRLFWLAQSGTGQVLLGVGRHHQLALINAVCGVLSFLCGLVLVREYGLFWMAVGASAPLVLVHGLVIPVYAMHVLGIPWRDYVGGAIVRPALGCVPFAIALVAMTGAVRPASVASIALICVAASPVLVLGALFVAFDARERALWLTRFLPARLKPAPR